MEIYLKKLLATVLLLCTTACTASKHSRVIINKDHVRTNIELNIRLFDSKSEMNKVIRREHRDLERNVEGLATWYTAGTNTCTVYVYEPNSNFDINTWGHELMHCVYGSWHY